MPDYVVCIGVPSGEGKRENAASGSNQDNDGPRRGISEE